MRRHRRVTFLDHVLLSWGALARSAAFLFLLSKRQQLGVISGDIVVAHSIKMTAPTLPLIGNVEI